MSTPVRMAARCWGSNTNNRATAVMVPANLIYDPDDPYAVGLFARGVLWEFSRELLTAGLERKPRDLPPLTGDVRITRECDDVRIDLTSPAGHVALWLRAQRVRRFLTRTYASVPAGTEADHIDWAAELDQLAAAGGEQ